LLRLPSLLYAYDEASQDVLGAEQWGWLAEELADPARRGAVTIVGSGFTVTPRNDRLVESWAVLYPQSLAKLLSLFALHPRPRLFFISGDIHVSQLTQESCTNVLGYPFFEFTSSGLTHAFGGGSGAITELTMRLTLNAYTRVGFLPANGRSAHVLRQTRAGRPPAATATEGESVEGAYFGGPSFGEIEIVWPEQKVASSAAAGSGAVLSNAEDGGSIAWRAVDADGTVRFEHAVPFAFLAPWPAAVHEPSGLSGPSLFDLRACAAANLSSGLTTPCAAVLASCEGHRNKDLSLAVNRGSSPAVAAFRRVMVGAALLPFILTPLLVAALLAVFSGRTLDIAWRRCTWTCVQKQWAPCWHAMLPVLCILLAAYVTAWWHYIVMPFEK
jgi:hypothetical protein